MNSSYSHCYVFFQAEANVEQQKVRSGPHQLYTRNKRSDSQLNKSRWYVPAYFLSGVHKNMKVVHLICVEFGDDKIQIIFTVIVRYLLNCYHLRFICTKAQF